MTREEIIQDIREELSKVERDLAMMENHALEVGIGRTDPVTTNRRLDHLYGLITQLKRLVAEHVGTRG